MNHMCFCFSIVSFYAYIYVCVCVCVFDYVFGGVSGWWGQHIDLLD
jgi:hypothetical protein